MGMWVVPHRPRFFGLALVGSMTLAKSPRTCLRSGTGICLPFGVNCVSSFFAMILQS